MSQQSALAPTRARHKVSNYSKSTKWSQEEDEMLLQLVGPTFNQNWVELTKFFPTKSAQQISERWEKVLDPHLVKGSWTREEDEIIIEFVREHGVKNWTKLAEKLPGRIGKQCRERWTNHLCPSVTKKQWTNEEDQRLVQLHERLGNQWTLIATYFEGRTDNCVKNRWNSSLKRRIERIANGEPEFKKRGRKPKARLYAEAAPRAEPDVHSECESPSQNRSAHMFLPLNVFSFNPVYENALCRPSAVRVMSLEQNRLNFHNLIMKNVIM